MNTTITLSIIAGFLIGSLATWLIIRPHKTVIKREDGSYKKLVAEFLELRQRKLAGETIDYERMLFLEREIRGFAKSISIQP